MSLKDKPLKKCHTDKRKMIDELHSEIVKGKTNEELNEYYQDNGLLLDKYYNFDNIQSSIDSSEKGDLIIF